MGTAVHEIGHALGLWHEHARQDRNDYVEILFDNIRAGTVSNFQLQDIRESVDLGVPYDYASVMHYHKKVTTFFTMSNGSTHHKTTIINYPLFIISMSWYLCKCIIFCRTHFLSELLTLLRLCLFSLFLEVTGSLFNHLTECLLGRSDKEESCHSLMPRLLTLHIVVVSTQYVELQLNCIKRFIVDLFSIILKFQINFIF